MFDAITKKLQEALEMGASLFASDGIEGVAPLSKALPYISYSEDNLLNMSESTGFLISITPNAYISEAGFQGILETLVASLPDHSYLHCSLWASPYLDGYLSGWDKQSSYASDILKTQSSLRKKHFLQAIKRPWAGERGTIREFTGYLGVSLSHGKNTQEKLILVRDKIIRELENHNVGASQMSAEEFLFWTRTWLNMPPPEKPVDPTWFKMTPLNAQIVDPNTRYKQEDMSLRAEHDDWCITPLLATGFPEQYDGNEWASMAGSAFNAWQQMSSPFAYHLMAIRGSSKSDKAFAARHFSDTEKTLRYPWVPKIKRESEYRDATYLKDKLDKSDDAVVKIMISSTVFSSKKEHEQAISQLSTLGQGRRFKWQPLKSFALPFYLMQCPLYGGNGMGTLWAKQGRFRTVTMSAMTHLLPICAPSTTASDGMLLTGISGNLFGFDNFSKSHENFNLAITGASGSGKSVFVQELMARNLSLPNRRVFVVDIGKSYEATCQVLGGQYVDFKTGEQISMNPFTFIAINDWSDVKAQLLIMIMGMVGLGSHDRISSIGTHVADTLESAWEQHKNELTFTHIMALWESHYDSRMHELALRLKPFTKYGDYGRWFEAPCNINLDNSLVVLELEHLKTDPRLMEIIVMMLITHMTNLMYCSQDRGERIMCVFEEIWAILKNDAFAECIDEGYRRARKYNGSFVSSTQSVMDFNKTAITRALIKNSDNLIYLGSDLEDIDSAVRHDLMGAPSQYAREFIKSPLTKKGKSSKCYILSKKGGHERMGRLFLDGFSKALYSTDAAIFGHIRHKVDMGMSWQDAVMHAMQQMESR